VPWLRTLDATRTLAGALAGAWAMSIAFTLAVFAWFGVAVERYTGLGAGSGLAVLLVAAPLLQPQFLAFALVRHVAGRRYAPMVRALAGASAWVAAEWLVPKLLGDTLGHGLQPSKLLRQAADLGGASGLTLLLVLANEGVATVLARRRDGVRALAAPLVLAVLPPVLLAGYGLVALANLPAPGGKPLRIGLVQSNIADYERLRRERGAGEVVREVLDTHFAMSYDAIERQGADAVLWSETVYPTTFGHPKSEPGAEFDREILATVDAARVPFVFGTYDRDTAGEYNAAAFVMPGRGLLGFYRKTRLFPFTEHVPAWLDGPVLRRWLPWAGTWQPGNGARVLPLLLADGREVPVLPLICLDDTDSGLAIDGARLGAQAILTLSNDAWFNDGPQGAALHQAAAAFRSIETRLPQFRVTTTGISAVIDPMGDALGTTKVGERTLVIGEMPVRDPPHTLMVAWGDWVGRAAVAFLVLLIVGAGLRAWHVRRPRAAPTVSARPALPADVVIMPPAARLAAGLLRALARGSLLAMAIAALLGDAAWPTNPLAQLRLFGVFFLAPEACAWCVLRAFAARASIEGDALVLARGVRRVALPLRDIVAVEPWRLPIPAAGAWLRLADGERRAFVHRDPEALATTLAATLHRAPAPSDATHAGAYPGSHTDERRGLLDRPTAKFVLLPLALAIPAFRLHQHIAYGSAFGEYLTYGLAAYASAFAIWWATWIMAVLLVAAVVRAAIEAGTFAAALTRPQRAPDARRWLEAGGLAVLWLGLPAWLLLRIA
jgi:apolipoprotein N-acyltransferase